jgi:small subunit ribosomal protein S8e
MVQYHKAIKAKRSGSGGKKRSMRDKVRIHYGGFFRRTHFEKEKEARKKLKGKYGQEKIAVSKASHANVSTPEGVKKATILSVVSNEANRHYSRENIITKGAILETNLGKVRVISRPGQHGVINAVLIEKK